MQQETWLNPQRCWLLNSVAYNSVHDVLYGVLAPGSHASAHAVLTMDLIARSV